MALSSGGLAAVVAGRGAEVVADGDTGATVVTTVAVPVAPPVGVGEDGVVTWATGVPVPVVSPTVTISIRMVASLTQFAGWKKASAR